MSGFPDSERIYFCKGNHTHLKTGNGDPILPGRSPLHNIGSIDVNYIDGDRSTVNSDFEDTIHWLRKVHSRSKFIVVAIEEIYNALKRGRITPVQARERIKAEGLDQTGGAS